MPTSAPSDFRHRLLAMVVERKDDEGSDRDGNQHGEHDEAVDQDEIWSGTARLLEAAVVTRFRRLRVTHISATRRDPFARRGWPAPCRTRRLQWWRRPGQ